MDTRQLEYFVAVADCLNFTKAAQQFYISQTAISQQIKSLEENLKVKLFKRNNRSVELTSAGNIFYKDAKFIIAKTNEAINKVQLTTSGYSGFLNIGIIPGHEQSYLPKLLRNFRRQYPLIDICIKEDNIENLNKQLQEGLLDVTFNVDFSLDKYKNIRWKSLTKHPLYAVLYKNHPLSKEKKLTRNFLRNENFIFIKRSAAPYGFDRMISNCIDCGFSPKIAHKTDSIDTMFLMIKAEMGITIFPKYFENDDLVFIKMDGENEYIESVLAWNSTNANPVLSTFLDNVY
ncbi:LysR substrate-binding domain-containing protein [Clostridium sp. SHJSY1]|uniref:LysR family transcriptional regulator n=1 Tax=Clostridium sp. SHJSY1 TaxID=2942483 RepID=UPI002874FFBC|nr:LysR substrate-binding domain-containing protein [Clostridium sp. SHJSY1]MDS0524199.1 LysR substrate-binding domain-containing protein [Clostridium sp. SHJSY1]